MERISEIRKKRELAFYKNRMVNNKERELDAARKLVAANPEMYSEQAPELMETISEDEEMIDEPVKQKIPILLKNKKRKLASRMQVD